MKCMTKITLFKWVSGTLVIPVPLYQCTWPYVIVLLECFVSYVLKVIVILECFVSYVLIAILEYC